LCGDLHIAEAKPSLAKGHFGAAIGCIQGRGERAGVIADRSLARPRGVSGIPLDRSGGREQFARAM